MPANRPYAMDLRKSKEQLDAEGWVDPGVLPANATLEQFLSWSEQHAKMFHPADDEYREACLAAAGNV